MASSNTDPVVKNVAKSGPAPSDIKDTIINSGDESSQPQSEEEAYSADDSDEYESCTEVTAESLITETDSESEGKLEDEEKFNDNEPKKSRLRIASFVQKNPYKFSNREAGARIVGYFELMMTPILIIGIFLAWTNPSIFFPTLVNTDSVYWQDTMPYRYVCEIGLVFVRALLSSVSGSILIFGSFKRHVLLTRLSLFLTTSLTSFQYTYLLLQICIYENDPYVTFLTLPEIFLRIFTTWTIMEFIAELRYYEERIANDKATTKKPGRPKLFRTISL